MSGQQEIFTELLVRLREKYDVYDGALPPEGTNYPFLYIADASSQTHKIDKFSVLANVSVCIHVWHDNPRQRGTLSAIMEDVVRTASSIQRTETFYWIQPDIYYKIIPDDSTGATLMHGIVDCNYEMI